MRLCWNSYFSNPQFTVAFSRMLLLTYYFIRPCNNDNGKLITYGKYLSDVMVDNYCNTK